MGTRWWTEDDNTLLKLKHAEGKSKGQIAREMERSTQTVDMYARRLGLDWSRAPLIEATLAHVADAKARRARLELGFLEDAEKLRLRLFAPITYVGHGGKEYDEARWTENEPIPSDMLKLTQAATIALAHSIRIAEHDSDAGLSTAIGMLDRVAAAVDAAVIDLDDLI